MLEPAVPLHLAGHVTASPAVDRRVLVAFPVNYVAMGHWMMRGLVPDVDLGVWPDGHRVSLVGFDRKDQVDLGAFGAVVILSGPPVGDLKQAWGMAARLSANRFAGLRVGLALSHSDPLLAAPDRLIDVATLLA